MYDVEIVMPVYNEGACISDVLNDWMRELDLLNISYRILVLNDGSRTTLQTHLHNITIIPKLKSLTRKIQAMARPFFRDTV